MYVLLPDLASTCKFVYLSSFDKTSRPKLCNVKLIFSLAKDKSCFTISCLWTHRQNLNQSIEINALTSSIVSQVMWFWEVGVRLCWDWQHLKMALRHLLLPCLMFKQPTNWGKWLYLIRKKKKIPLASSPHGRIIIIKAGWPWVRQQAALRFKSNAHHGNDFLQ